MILLLDTSTPDCHLYLYDGDTLLLEDTWHSDRELAEKIFTYLEEKMAAVDKNWNDITGLGLMKGPGSFTGLRIGASVLNAIAADRKVPIVGVSRPEDGENWATEALIRLKNGENDQLILPDYGRPARITQPRK